MAVKRENIIDPTTGLVTLRKKPDESRVFDIDATKYMRDADTITSITSMVAVAAGNVTQVNPLAIGSKTHDSAQTMQAGFSGGTNGEDYEIDVVFVTTAEPILHVKIMLWVREDF